MISRRSFLQTFAFSWISVRAFPAIYTPRSPVRLVDKNEPGLPIIVSGHVYAEDGRTPLNKASFYLYHTDASGYYSRPQSDPRKSRIHAWLNVDSDGFYSFRTIWPGHYAVANPPASHIHVHLAAPGVPDHWIDSFLFAGDPNLTSEQITKNEGLGTFSAIMNPVKRAGGVTYFRRDIRLNREVAQRNQLVNGWYRNP
jgi:protocatechuate 3,4-dioxygenase beta subunit